MALVVKLYGLLASPNTLRAVAALNEKNVPYELISVDVNTGAHKQPDFLALNPFGQIPALKDGDVTLFESRAIAKYIAKKHAGSGPDLLRDSNPSEAAMVEVWLEAESQEFNPPASALVFEALIKPMLGGSTDAAVVETQAEKLGKVLDVYEGRLSVSKFLAGGEFSLADLNHAPYLNLLMNTKKAELVTSRPHVRAWWEAVAARPAWKKTAGAA